MCDGLHLPYRDGCFDAVLSIAGDGQTHTEMKGGLESVESSHSVTDHYLHMHEA